MSLVFLSCRDTIAAGPFILNVVPTSFAVDPIGTSRIVLSRDQESECRGGHRNAGWT